MIFVVLVFLTDQQAPEVLNHQAYSLSADVYSFGKFPVILACLAHLCLFNKIGICCWEMYTRESPFKSANTFSIPVMVTKGERPSFPKDCSKTFKNLVKSCWQPNPKSRPSMNT